jgi:hypothetical protein
MSNFLNLNNMQQFTIEPNEFLKNTTQAFYHQDYIAFKAPGNPDFINHLKNQFGDTNIDVLKSSETEFEKILCEDLPQIKSLCGKSNLTVCVIPRAKAENSYLSNQLLFKKVISNIVDKLVGFSNGTTYIIRHTNTRTTHMDKSSHGGDGDLPYAGITKNTCRIDDQVRGKDILLIDDIYTKTINIDEDCIQALLDKGANSVIFYAVGKTINRNNVVPLAPINKNNYELQIERCQVIETKPYFLTEKDGSVTNFSASKALRCAVSYAAERCFFGTRNKVLFSDNKATADLFFQVLQKIGKEQSDLVTTPKGEWIRLAEPVKFPGYFTDVELPESYYTGNVYKDGTPVVIKSLPLVILVKKTENGLEGEDPDTLARRIVQRMGWRAVGGEKNDLLDLLC